MAKRSGKTWKRRTVRLTCLVLVAAACVVGWDALRPLVSAESVPVYAQYTVETGDIETSMSLSGSIDLRDSETFSASQSTSVQEVYVEADQRVGEGDDLLRLANGETIRSTIEGTVTELNVAAGDAVWPQMTLITVGDLDNLRVTISVDEYDIDKISVGQACSVTVIPLGLTFETEIDHINRVSASTGSVATYTVTADIDAPENVLPGMQATVSIPRESVSDVPVLAMAALSFEEDGAPYVLMGNAEGGYDEVAIETGLNDGVYVEITDGLEAGDAVYVQTGVEDVESALSLSALYKAVFGETTVVNDRSGNRGMGAGAFPAQTGNMELPEDMELPEGAQFEQDTTQGAQTAQDTEIPEGMEPPGNAEMPEGTSGRAQTEGAGAETDDAEGENSDAQ